MESQHTHTHTHSFRAWAPRCRVPQAGLYTTMERERGMIEKGMTNNSMREREKERDRMCEKLCGPKILTFLYFYLNRKLQRYISLGLITDTR